MNIEHAISIELERISDERVAAFTPVTDLQEVRYPLRKRIKAESKLEIAALKTRQAVMLDSIGDHEHSEEIEQLVREEYKIAMMEVSSGNGKNRCSWDYEKGRFSEHVTALASEQGDHNRNGLADELVDSTEGIADKNQTTYFDNEAQEYLTVTESKYSLWDTIYLNGALIVRLSKQWKGGFRADKWLDYSKRRELIKHNKLLAMPTMESIRDSERELRASRRLERANRYDDKKAKQLARMAAYRESNKVGFNAFEG